MSLNPFEQRIFDYWQTHRDEERFWQEKVRALAARHNNPIEAALHLERDLWHYYEERSAAIPLFRNANPPGALRRISMRNLAELLVRLWTDLRPKKKPGADAINGHN